MIFGRAERLDTGPAKYSESIFSFLNRSARAEAGRVRDKMEEWLSDYPVNERGRLIASLQSSDDLVFLAAYFELYLFTLLRRLGYSLEVHPATTSGAKKPDLVARETNELGVYVEAILASEATRLESNQTVIMNQVYDILNEMDSPDFFIGLKISGAPKTQPSAKKIREQVSEWLKSLDRDVIADLHQPDTLRGLPNLEINHDGWHIVFLPIAKSPAARGKPGIRPIGTQMKGFELTKTKEAIRDAIGKKATRYGEMDRPYIIAINVLSPVLDQEDVLDALFGSEQLAFWTDMPDDHPPEWRRARDGVWLGPSGTEHTRVSGVLIVKYLTPWTIAHSDVTLYHNPWAQRRYIGSLTTLSQALPENGDIVFKPGVHPRELFGLEMNWPEI